MIVSHVVKSRSYSFLILISIRKTPISISREILEKKKHFAHCSLFFDITHANESQARALDIL